MSKHTPGPWVRKNGNPTFVPLRAHHCEKLGFSIGFVSLDDNDGCGEPAANARLIAAAPELLEAARLVIAWYEAECDPSKTDFYQRMQMCRDSEDALRAAIAKATGEKQ